MLLVLFCNSLNNLKGKYLSLKLVFGAPHFHLTFTIQYGKKFSCLTFIAFYFAHAKVDAYYCAQLGIKQRFNRERKFVISYIGLVTFDV